MSRMRSHPVRLVAIAASAIVALALGWSGVVAVEANAPATAGVTPIADGGSTTLPTSTGTPGYGTRILMLAPPQNPHLAPNPFSNVHNDAWLTDTARIMGPSGRDLVVTSNRLADARRDPTSAFFDCGALTFDRHGRIVTVCIGPGEDSLVMVDPTSLAVLAYLQIPVPTGESAGYGAAYMFLDDADRAYLTVGDHVWVVAEQTTAAGPGFVRVADYDLSAAVPSGDGIQSVMPDWQGRLWFMVQQAGVVGVFDPKTRRTRTVDLAGSISNSFAIDHTTAYVVTTARMYRLDAGVDGRPRITWSQPYANVGYTKKGQKSAGSGTSPTILGNGAFVAINDNADQMHVVAYRTAAKLGAGERRTVCTVPVFPRGKGASENSLIAWNRSMVIQNTYGYVVDPATLRSTPAEPGLARIDIDADASGCRVVWSNSAVRVPSVLGKVSLPAGMLYTMTRVDDPVTAVPAYYWAAIDMRTGDVRWQVLAGTGSAFDGYVPGAAIGPTGALYVGLYGGIASAR